MKNELDLFIRSKDVIWTDKYIAKNLLAAHLDPQNDAASRKPETINKTVSWIMNELESKTSVLDLGCGTGLYSERLTENGLAVTGVDISKNSIKHAKRSAKKKSYNIKYYNLNYLTDELPGMYDNALCIYCDFGALIPTEQIQFLKKIYSALTPEGIFIFDVLGAEFSKSNKEYRTWTYYDKDSFWHKGAHFLLDESVHYPEAKAWGRRAIVLDKKFKKEKEYIIWDTYYTKESLESLLMHNGFSIEKIETNLIESTNWGSSDVLFVKARKK